MEHRKTFITVAVAAALFMQYGSLGAAGIPVIDVTNLAQQIQQVKSWVTQLQEMKNQLKQAQETFKSLNGIRGMAGLVNDPQLRKYLPPEWKQTLDLVNTGGGQYGGISASIEQIRASFAVMTPQQLGLNPFSPEGRLFRNTQNQAALSRALGEEAYKRASERIDKIQVLLDKVNGAPEQKDILDLSARIQAEQVMLANEQAKLSIMTQLLAAQRDIQQQQAREISMKATRGPMPAGWGDYK